MLNLFVYLSIDIQLNHYSFCTNSILHSNMSIGVARKHKKLKRLFRFAFLAQFIEGEKTKPDLETNFQRAESGRVHAKHESFVDLSYSDSLPLHSSYFRCWCDTFFILRVFYLTVGQTTRLSLSSHFTSYFLHSSEDFVGRNLSSV
jgi:hypothetical protein